MDNFTVNFAITVIVLLIGLGLAGNKDEKWKSLRRNESIRYNGRLSLQRLRPAWLWLRQYM